MRCFFTNDTLMKCNSQDLKKKVKVSWKPEIKVPIGWFF